jgi:hypothetical protein
MLVGHGQSASAAGERSLNLAFRNHDASSASSSTIESDLVPVLLPEDGIDWQQDVRPLELTICESCRVNVGALVLSSEPTELVFISERLGGSRLLDMGLAVPAFGHAQHSLSVGPGLVRIQLEVSRMSKNGRIFPYAVVIDGATGRSQYVVFQPVHRPLRLAERLALPMAITAPFAPLPH